METRNGYEKMKRMKREKKPYVKCVAKRLMTFFLPIMEILSRIAH